MNIALLKRSFNISKVLENSELSCRVTLRCVQGTGEACIYQLSPVILLAFFDYQAKAYLMSDSRRSHILEINYCTEGRVEHMLQNERLMYLGKNDLAFSLESCHTPAASFPLGYFSGVGLVIDLMKQEALQSLFQYRQLNMEILVKKLFSIGPDICISLEPCMQDFQKYPDFLQEAARCDWLFMRVMELLLYLYHYPFETEKPKAIYERQQAEIIKNIHRVMTEHLDRRYTIDELAKQYFISPTKLKTTFKGIYGKPIRIYMKQYRLEQAARWLRESEMSVKEISEATGYQSISKFGASFKQMSGNSPLAYRKKYQNQKE